MTDPLRQYDTLEAVRPRGVGSGAVGEILQASRMPTEPYQPPAWSERLTIDYGSLSRTQPQRAAGGRGETEFPFRFQAPNIFGDMGPAPAAPGAFEELAGSELGQSLLTGLGAMPGERVDFHNGIATAPITVANFPTYMREGALALLSSVFLEGGYQQQEGGVFGEQVPYTGPDDLEPHQAIVKGVIDAGNAIGDVAWGAFDGLAQWNRDATAQYRGRALRDLFSRGESGRPVIPLEVGFVDNVFSSLGLGPSSARYSLAELRSAAMREGLDIYQMAAEYWDVPIEVVAAIARQPDMSDQQLYELVEGMPLSQDALTNLVAEGGFQIGTLAAGVIGTGGLGAFAGGVRAGAQLGPSAFGAALRGGGIAARTAGRAAQATSFGGHLTRRALQLNALNTGAGWTIRSFEWGIKQYGGIVGDEGLVRLGDYLLWEMPWSMNPGLNLIDGFTMHPVRHLRELRGVGTGGRRLRIGDEGSISDAGAIALARQGDRSRWHRGWLMGPDNPYRTPQGQLDKVAMTATRTAAQDMRIIVAGKEEVIPKESPIAVAIDRFGAMTVDDLHDNLLQGLGWEKRWVIEAFDSGKYDLTPDDLRDALVYVYANIAREQGFSPRLAVGPTLRESSREFVRVESPVIIDMLFSDLQGRSAHAATSMKGQFWRLAELNDSRMAQLKARFRGTYDPHVAFEGFRDWVAASKRMHQAYLKHAEMGNLVVTYARRLNPGFLRDFRAHLLLHYERGQRVSMTDVKRLMAKAGPVELYVDDALARAIRRERVTREQLIRLLDTLDEQAAQDVRTVRRIDPRLAEDWEPGVDFAADARVLGIEPEQARLIENARRLEEPPNTIPPAAVLQRVAKDTGGSADAMALDPQQAWRRVFEWYDDVLGQMTDHVATRDAAIRLHRHIATEAAAGRFDHTVLPRVTEATDRIAAELVNPPRRRPIGAKGEPPEGVTWASEDGMTRWAAATNRAKALSNDIDTFLEDPLNGLRIVGEETADERAIGQFVALAGDEGRLENVLSLLRFYREQPELVLLDDAAKALLDDATVHPYRKIDALASAEWPPSLPPELRLIANGLRDVDEDALLRELAGSIEPASAEANVIALVDGLTAKVAAHADRRAALVDELLTVDRAYDAVEGTLTTETRLLVDRRLAAGVEPDRPLVRTTRDEASASARQARQEIAPLERELRDIDERIAQHARRLEDIGAEEPQPYRPPEPVEVRPAEEMAPERPLIGREGEIERAYAEGDIERAQELNLQAEAENAAAGRGGRSEAFARMREEAEGVYGRTLAADDPVRGTKTGTGTVPTRLRLVEADELIDSWDEGYPRDRLQPRDTRTAESEQLVRDIAGNPLPEPLLRTGPKLDEGAPVISKEGWVEVGNHRVRGLKQAYDEGNAEAYVQAIIERAEEFGLSAEQVKLMRRPVLVREVPDQYVNAKYARAWNQATGMSARSEAGSIGKNLDLDTMADLSAKGSLDDVLAGAEGAAIIKRIMGEGGEAFAKKYIEDGVLTPEGQVLVKTAIVTRVVGDERVAAAIVGTSSIERGAAPLLARGIIRESGRLMQLTQKVGADNELALGDLLSRAHYLLRETEGKPPKVTGGEQLAFGAAEEASERSFIRGLLEQQVAEGTATAEEAGFAAAIADMTNAAEVQELFRAYVDPVIGSADRAGTAQMFGEEVLGAGATRAQRLNIALRKVNELRTAKALERAAKEEGGTVGMFTTNVDDLEVREIPPIPDPDGIARSSFAAADGGAATSADVPVLGSMDEAIAARTAGKDRVVVDGNVWSSDLAGKTVRVRNAMEKRVYENLRATDTATFEQQLEDRIAAFTAAYEQGDDVRFYELTVQRLDDEANAGLAADFFTLAYLSINEGRWSKAGKWLGKYKRRTGPRSDRPLELGNQIRLARSRHAEAQGLEAVLGPGEAVEGGAGAAIISGRAGRTIDAEYTARTGLEVDEQALANELRDLADTGAEVIVRGDDAVTQAAARTHGNLPRTPPERPRLTILNEQEFAQRRTGIQNQLERLRALRTSAEEQLTAARQAARERGETTTPDLELPEEAWVLWQRYVYEPLGEAFGVSRPYRVGEVEDVLRSLDYGMPAADRAMSVAEQEQLRMLLRDFLGAKYDEWRLPQMPTRILTRRVRTKLTEDGVSGVTPTEHSLLLDELAQELATKVYKADEPLEGYLGVGYEFIPPPTKAVDGGPLGTRLFYETGMTDLLRGYDDIVPGLGPELAARRMATVAKRVDDVRAHEAAAGLGRPGIAHAARSLWDTAFGARRQQTINEQTVGRFIEDVLELTPDDFRRMRVDPELFARLEAQRKTMLGLVRHLHRKMEEELRLPFFLMPMRTHRRIGLLDPVRLERWTHQYLDDAGEAGGEILALLRARQEAGVKTPVWDAWRRADNRFRAYFRERNGGMATLLDSLYETPLVRGASEKASSLIVNYHIFRFLADARWLAMEFLEAPTLLLAREGPRALWEAIEVSRGKRQAELLFASRDAFDNAMSEWAWWATQSDMMGTGGRMTQFRNSAVFSQVSRAQRRGFVNELKRLALADERITRMMREFGDTPEEYLRRLDRDWRLLTTRQRRGIPEDEMRALLEPYLAERTISQAEFDDAIASGTWAEIDALKLAIQHADDPATRLLLRRLEVMTSQAIDDAAQLIFGQVDRSNVQRLLNHPLLYWPISYQIKATKWLGGLFFDRFMGVESGAGPAVTLGILWEQHRDALRDDPDYHRFLQEHEQATFFLSMLLPITPWDIGVSLSPWSRLALDPEYRRNLFGVGPMYTWWQLVPRLIQERSRQAGPVGEVARPLQRVFPVTVPIAPVPGPPSGRPSLVEDLTSTP